MSFTQPFHHRSGASFMRLPTPGGVCVCDSKISMTRQSRESERVRGSDVRGAALGA